MYSELLADIYTVHAPTPDIMHTVINSHKWHAYSYNYYIIENMQ